MNKIVRICSGRALVAPIQDAKAAIEDAVLMAVEKAICIAVETRNKDNSIEFRAACDEIIDRLRVEY